MGFIEFSASERGLARIDRGRPSVPEEIGAADMPGEGGLEHDAISFTKGCYLGQEVVARMHNVGKAQRDLLWSAVKVRSRIYRLFSRIVNRSELANCAQLIWMVRLGRA